jgi:hypothetical protein
MSLSLDERFGLLVDREAEPLGSRRLPRDNRSLADAIVGRRLHNCPPLGN